MAIGQPASPLVSTVAVLATTNAAGALALELTSQVTDIAYVELLTAIVAETIRAAQLAVQALRSADADALIQLAHATA